MHILFVTYEFVTEKGLCGGLAHYLANISEIMAAHGHKITILVMNNHDDIKEWKKNITVVSFVYNHIENGKKLGAYIEYFTKVNISEWLNKSTAINQKIREIDKKEKIDIVQYCGDNMSVWYRIKNIPSVVRLSSFGPWLKHACLPDSNMNSMQWLNSWESRLLLYSFLKADAVYSPSTCVAQIVNSKLCKKIDVIESPCVIDESTVYIMDHTNKLYQQKYLLFFGSLSILKGINVIRDSIHAILKKYPQVLFVFAGHEVNKGVVQKIMDRAGKYRERVIYLGEIREPNELYMIIKNAYACVLPSRADNLPNTCIEAMGLGKIVIGTYGASFEQLIKNKESGLLIKRDSPKALIKAVDYLMGMTEGEWSEMGKKAKESVVRMSPDKIYEQLILFYKKVINQKNFKKGRNKDEKNK